MKTGDKNSIRSLFEPSSFAVIGASRNPKKIGHTITRNIIEGGFKGEVYPVNIDGGELLGRKVHKSIGDIKGAVDVASIAVPAKYVVEIVKECAEKGVKHLHIITSGFSEVGNLHEEREIVRTARAAGMRILGPNIFGLFSAKASLNSTFSASAIMPGSVAILTQSGALGIAMIGKTAVDNIGLSAIVSIGNKSDIDEADLLSYLIHQDETEVIMMYIEGVKNGETLIETLKEATLRKPVIVIKSGRSARGAMAAASHTGSLAGSDAVFGAIMKQCGVLRAESIDEAFNWCKYLAFTPRPRGKRSVIVTNGGGIGVMATDACEKYGISLFDDQEILKEVFEPATPSFGSTKNPVDITGGANSADYVHALTAPASSEHMDSTIALYCETATFDYENLTPMIRDTFHKHAEAGKPITYAIVGGESVDRSLNTLRKENIPVYGNVYEAVSCLSASYRYQEYINSHRPGFDEMDIDTEKIDSLIDTALSEGRKFLLSHEGSEVMSQVGIGIPAEKVTRSIGEAVDFAESIGYPVVMKIVSRDILHKSDAGGIALDLEDKEEVIDAYEAIMHNAKAYNPEAKIDGILVSEMVKQGVELIVGARRDPSFGPVVMCGLGGIYVEIMKDITFRGLPIDRNEALAMIKEIRSYPLLLGARGEKRKDIEAAAETILKVGTVIRRCGRITDIEINPVMVYDRGMGIKSVDARILITEKKETDQ